MSGIDDELIQKGENLLLTFKNVRNEVGAGNAVFDMATEAALNLSVAGFGSVESASKMMGKALNDPIKGMTALGRAGVTFSEEQKKAIKAMVESNDLLGAQKLILKEVESQVGGSAKAFGETFPGQLSKLKNSFEEMAGGIAQTLLPHLQKLITWVTEHMPQIQAVIETVMQGITKAIEGAAIVIDTLITTSQRIWDKVDEVWPSIAEAIGLATGEIDDHLIRNQRTMENYEVAHSNLWEAIKQNALQVKDWYKGELEPGIANVLTAIRFAWDLTGDHIIHVARGTFEKIKGMIEPPMQLVLATVRGALALLRGDWGKTFEELLNVVKHFADIIFGNAVRFGKNLMSGVSSGLAAGWGKVNAWLGGFPGRVVSAVGDLSGTLYAAGAQVLTGFLDGLKSKWEDVKGFLSGLGPQIPRLKGPPGQDKMLLHEVGQLIIEGLQNGMQMQWEKLKSYIDRLAPELAEKYGKVVDAAIAAITAKEGALQAAFDNLASAALSAFDKVSSEFQTRTEKKISAQDDRRAAKERADALSEAQQALAAAQSQVQTAGPHVRGQAKPEGFDEANQALLDARKQVADAEFAIQRAKDEKAAAQERKDYEAKRERQRFHLEQRLAKLQENFLQGEITTEQFNKRMINILNKAGVPLQNAAEKLGFALAAGLRAAIGEARQAAKELAAAIVEQIGGIAVSVKIHVSQSSSEGSKRALGGPVTAGKGYVVGERGPEFFVPSTSGTIIPNGGGGRMAMAGGGTVNHFHIAGSVVAERDLFTLIQKLNFQHAARNGSAGLG